MNKLIAYSVVSRIFDDRHTIFPVVINFVNNKIRIVLFKRYKIYMLASNVRWKIIRTL